MDEDRKLNARLDELEARVQTTSGALRQYRAKRLEHFRDQAMSLNARLGRITRLVPEPMTRQRAEELFSEYRSTQQQAERTLADALSRP